MRLRELQAGGGPPLAERHGRNPRGRGTRCAGSRGDSCPQQGAETPAARDSERGGTQPPYQQKQPLGPVAGPHQPCSAVAGGKPTGTHLRPLPSPWGRAPQSQHHPMSSAMKEPWASAWGWDPPTPSIPSEDPQKKPLNPPKVPVAPSPAAQLRRLVVVRVWVGFSCPRAVIVLIRSTDFDEGFARQKKKNKGGRQEEIIESQMTFPSPSLSAQPLLQPSRKIMHKGGGKLP